MQLNYVEIMKDRAEIRRLVRVANQRITRLRRSKLDDSPALRFVPDELGRFSVKGKQGNALRTEVAKLRRFLQAQTSTVRGYDGTLKNVAKITGMKYNKVREIREKSQRFFELASKVEQYLKNVQGHASAIGYNKIWEAINVYSKKENRDDLDNMNISVDDLILNIVDQVNEMDKMSRMEVDPAEIDMEGFTFLG